MKIYWQIKIMDAAVQSHVTGESGERGRRVGVDRHTWFSILQRANVPLNYPWNSYKGWAYPRP